LDQRPPKPSSHRRLACQPQPGPHANPMPEAASPWANGEPFGQPASQAPCRIPWDKFAAVTGQGVFS
jgi:hypothetical protein